MRNNQITYHSYADDAQIYLALSPNDYSPIDSLCQCIDEIKSWMCQNFLQLNKEKTEDEMQLFSGVNKRNTLSKRPKLQGDAVY